jgi:formylglycine-generating enzyme required for sulfatase activity
MFRRYALAFAILPVFLFFSSCSKENKSTEEKTTAPAAAPVPGSPQQIEMVLVPAGEFIFGTNDKASMSYPEQKINLPAFWMDKYEVTNAQFLDFSIKNNYIGEGAKQGNDWRLFFTPDKALFPVVYITWNDAQAYCKSLGKRLPTEEEWEKAARGIDGRAYPWGNEWKENRANTYEAGMNKPAAVGQFDDVSPYGAHDMLGNVQEWTASWYMSYKGNPKKQNETGKLRVVRGLSSHYRGKEAHLWDRLGSDPKNLFDFGCRCAKDATPEEAAKAAAK